MLDSGGLVSGDNKIPDSHFSRKLVNIVGGNIPYVPAVGFEEAAVSHFAADDYLEPLFQAGLCPDALGHRSGERKNNHGVDAAQGQVTCELNADFGNIVAELLTVEYDGFGGDAFYGFNHFG